VLVATKAMSNAELVFALLIVALTTATVGSVRSAALEEV
jgi:hypothetical protein